LFLCKSGQAPLGSPAASPAIRDEYPAAAVFSGESSMQSRLRCEREVRGALVHKRRRRFYHAFNK
jgi:hypothetical protein